MALRINPRRPHLAAAALLALVVWLTWPRKSKDNDGDPPQNGNR